MSSLLHRETTSLNDFYIPSSTYGLNSSNQEELTNVSVQSNEASSVSRIANDLIEFSSNGIRPFQNNNNNNSSVGFSPSSYETNVSSFSDSYLSLVEQSILKSTIPIELNETEEITVLGQRGIWVNKAEVTNWNGSIPIGKYEINEDTNPEVITKRVNQSLEYVQELAIRYLRPPTPPPPGEIIIVQQSGTLTPPAPPLVIRQQPPRPNTPEPLIVREAPPQPPPLVGRKVITIAGRRLPPPPRKVVIERLPQLPAKPQSLLVERWLSYSQVKRRVVFQRPSVSDPIFVRPRNVIVQWEVPHISVRREIKYLGVVKANPVEYVQKYGSSLRLPKDLPQIVLDIKTPDGIVLAADNLQQNSVLELEGDIQALGLVDLQREGLMEYKTQLQRVGISVDNSPFRYSAEYSNNKATTEQAAPFESTSLSISSILNDLFDESDKENDTLTIEESQKLFTKISSRLGKNYGDNEIRDFLNLIDPNKNGFVSVREFRFSLEKFLI